MQGGGGVVLKAFFISCIIYLQNNHTFFLHLFKSGGFLLSHCSSKELLLHCNQSVSHFIIALLINLIKVTHDVNSYRQQCQGTFFKIFLF